MQILSGGRKHLPEPLGVFICNVQNSIKKLPGISEDRNKRKISDAYIELGDNDFKRTG